MITFLAVLLAQWIGPEAPLVSVPPDATNIPYKCAGTGCVARPIASKFGDTVSICDFIGSICPSGGDDTAAITNGIAYLNSVGGTLLFPPGTYAVTNQFSITKAYARIVGYGAKIVQSGALKRGF